MFLDLRCSLSVMMLSHGWVRELQVWDIQKSVYVLIVQHHSSAYI
jgi:hypothetical protein